MGIFNAQIERSWGYTTKLEDAIQFNPGGISSREKADILRTLFNVHFNTEFLKPFIEGQLYSKQYCKERYMNQPSDSWLSEYLILKCTEGVIISDESPTYFGKLSQNFPGKDIKEEDCAQYPLLGEFIPSEVKTPPSNVNLYYYNILDCAEKDGVNYLIVLRYVYLHELMHKYFYKINPAHKYIPEEEEPMAEFGALFCLDLLVENGIADKSELDWALKHVKNKDGLLKHYSYGEELYRQYKAGNIELKSELESFGK